MSYALKRRAIPPARDPANRGTLEALATAVNELSGTIGAGVDRAVRVGELVEAGVLQLNTAGLLERKDAALSDAGPIEIADVNGLQAALDGKQPLATAWNTGNFDPATKADVSHSHAGYQTTSSVQITNASDRLSSNAYEAPTPGTGWPTGASGWWHLAALATHSNEANYYSMQMAAPFFSQDFYVRNTNGSGTTGWSRMLTSPDNTVAKIVKMTQAAYNALGTKDANTLYIIVG